MYIDFISEKYQYSSWSCCVHFSHYRIWNGIFYWFSMPIYVIGDFMDVLWIFSRQNIGSVLFSFFVWLVSLQWIALLEWSSCLFYLSPTIYETINMCNTVTVQACRRSDACSFVGWFVCLFIRCVSIFTKFCCWSLLPLLVINGMWNVLFHCLCVAVFHICYANCIQLWLNYNSMF